MKKNRLMNKVLKLSILVIVSLALAASGFTQRQGSRETAASFKSILAKVPANVRTEFLKSLMFNKGCLTGAYIGGVKASLKPAGLKGLLESCGCDDGWHEGWKCDRGIECKQRPGYMCNPDKCGGSNSLDVILKNVPANERGKFLESLDFANGQLTAAYVGGIRPHLSSSEFERLFGTLGITGGKLTGKIQGGYYKP